MRHLEVIGCRRALRTTGRSLTGWFETVAGHHRVAAGRAAEGIAQVQVTALRERVNELKVQLVEARRPWWRKLFR
jgi:hypothetical protein